MNIYPLKLYPAFKDYLWGGTKLHDFYPDCTTVPAAEAWGAFLSQGRTKHGDKRTAFGQNSFRGD